MLKKIKGLLFENQSLKQSIAKNTFWLFSGQIFGRLTRVIIVVYAARLLGPASWGAFSYAMSLVAFMTIFSDVGISAIVTKESAKNPHLSNHYFSTAFFLKLILLVFGSIILIFGTPYLTKIEEAKKLLPLIALILIFDSLRNFGFAISRAKEKMQLEGMNEIITNAAITAIGFLMLRQYQTSESLTLSYVFAVGIGFIIIAWQLKSYFLNLISSFDFSLIKPILTMAWPFALASSLGAIMINTDTIMLGWLKSAEEVGWYSAAQRPVQLLYVLPTLFAASLFPTFTRLAGQNKEKFKTVLETALKIAFLTALPIASGGLLLGKPIINLVFGPDYQNAAASFQILILTILIIFPSAIISNAIFANDQQRKFIVFSFLGALGNLFFNFLLIPVFGIAGCSLSTLITQIIANSFIWIKMKEINNFSIFPKIKKIIIASLLMGLTIIALKPFSLTIIIFAAAAVYLLSLKILKEELLNLG